MTDDELKLNRRRFLRHSAVAAAATGGVTGIVLWTDAQADDAPLAPPKGLRGGDVGPDDPYPYSDPPP